MKHFFEKRDRWGNGFSLWVILGCVFITPLCAWSLSKTHIENDIEHWLPADDPNAVTLNWSIKQFGLHEGDKAEGDSVLVSWDDSSLLDPRIEKLAQRLEGKPDEKGIRRGGLRQVARVVTPKDIVVRMVDHGVERDEAIKRLNGVLVGTGAFKVRLTEPGRMRQKEVTRELVAKAKSDLGLKLKILSATRDFESDDDEPVTNASNADTQAAEQAAAALAASKQSTADATTSNNEAGTDGSVPPPGDLPVVEFDPIPDHHFQVRWQGMLDKTVAPKVRELAMSLKGSPTSDSPDGVPMVEDCFRSLGSPVALSVVLSGAGEADKAHTMSLIRDAAIAVGVPKNQLHLGGRPVASTALNEGVKAAGWNREVPITQFHKRSVLLTSGIVGVVMAFLMLRSIRLAVMVLVVSYFTVFVTIGLVPATGGSMNMVLVLMPTFLLVVTMSGAIHMAHYWRHAALTDPETAVVKAFKLAAQPCFLATFTTAIGLLSLLTSDLKPVRDFGVYSAAGAFVGLAAVLYLLPSLILMLPSWKPKSEEANATRWEDYGHWCARNRNPIVWGYSLLSLVCLLGLNWFRTETKVIRYFPDEMPVVQDYWFLEENLAGIIPVDVIVRFDRDSQGKLNFLDRLEIVRTIENRMREHPEISGAIALPDFRPVAEKPAADAGFLAKGGYNRRATEMELRVREGKVSGTKAFYAVAKKGHDLHAVGDGALNQPDDELWRITAQVFVMSDAKLGDLIHELHGIAQSVLKFHAGSNHVVTGMVPVFLQTQEVLLSSLIKSFAVAYLTISIVMILAVGHVGAGLILMLPNVFPIIQVFGLISFFKVPVDIGTMMTTSIALGIAVDGTLHKLTWFRKGIADGMSRDDAIALSMGHGGPAIWETTMVLALGMLMLFPSDLLLISRFGWLMAAIIFAAMIGDLLYLPALFGGPLGTMVIRHDQQKRERQTSSNSLLNSALKMRTADGPENSAIPQPHIAPVDKSSSSQPNRR